MSESFSERKKRLRESGIETGESLYDPDFGLCAMAHKDRPLYTGHDVAWSSSQYCRLLFEEGKNLELANSILGRILDYQNLDAGVETYGNFIAYSEWNRVVDINGVSFVLYTIGDLLLEHPEKLTPENTKRMREAIDVAAVGLLRRGCVWFYTNIFLLNLVDKFILARILERSDLARCAVAEWNRWVERIGVENISEFNSNAYTLIQLGALLGIEKYSTDPRVASEARKIADNLVINFAAYFHPETGRLTGTMSRAYRPSLINTESGDSTLAYYLFGVAKEFPGTEPRGDGSVAYLSRYDYSPPEQAVKLINEKVYPFEITERNAIFWGKDYEPGVITRWCYQTKDFTIASYNGVWASYGHEVPLLISIPASKRKFVFMDKNPEYVFVDHYNTQKKNCIVGGMYLHHSAWGMFKESWKNPPYLAEKRIDFGPVGETTLLIDGKPWNGEEQDLSLPVTVTAARSGVMVGIRLFDPPSETSYHPVKTRLEVYRDDLLLTLTFLNERDIDTIINMPPSIVGMVMEVEAGDDADFFSRRLSDLDIQQEVTDNVWRFRASPNGEEITADTPLTPDTREKFRLENAPPITEPLFECPGIRVMPNEWFAK